MGLVAPLIGLVFICLVIIATTSIVINISNRIRSDIDKTEYTKSSCPKIQDYINNSLNVINIVRIINIVLLVIGILIIVLVIVAGIISVYSGEAEVEAAESKVATVGKQTKSGLAYFLGSKAFYFVVLGLLTLIFAGFSFVYFYVLANFNQVDTKCFSGSDTDPDSQLGAFTNAKSIATINGIICLVLFVISIIGMIITYFVFRNKPVEKQTKA
jgi:beta-lactamase regulating signal transducer with metallopeptidase domain